ncbi:MAG: hypothetical protein DMF89_18400 [Acidobacteria bacterium]|nr:MAG: hypothetical protein DMF89_18400 [Acidobacteriota bacterium]
MYLNWCLGFKEIGCQVVWLAEIKPDPSHPVAEQVLALRKQLSPYGLADRIACWSHHSLPVPLDGTSVEIEEATEADLLVNLNYNTPATIVDRFRQSALIDIDPGLFQVWISDYNMSVPKHTCYFSTGETVGQPGAKFPDLGIAWHYVPPAVSVNQWRPVRTTPPAPFTTISHWVSRDWLRDEDGQLYSNEKRSGFMPFIDLPRHTSQALELALSLSDRDGPDRALLQERGWRIQDSRSVCSSAQDYQQYIQGSLGEFSCVKPSCIRFQNAWISDRTLCYMASGKPAVVQHTGPSKFLPDASGLFRFRDFQQAVDALEQVAADYDGQSRLARALAEEYFDARKVARRVLERALD